MSSYYKQPPYTPKHKELNFVNAQVAIHDLHCGCNEPLNHIITSIFRQEPSLKFNQEESQLIQKCLTTGDDGKDVLDDFGDAELEKLFDGDFGEEDDDR